MKLFLLNVSFELNKNYDENDNSMYTTAHKLINLVCKTEDGYTHLITVTDWLPWLYFRGWDQIGLRKRRWRVDYSSVEQVKRIFFVGFSNETQIPMMKVRLYKYPVWSKADEDAEIVFENGNVKAETKFMCETGLRVGAWFVADKSDDELSVNDLHCSTETLVPKLTILAYDLETTGRDPKTSTINQVCCVFQKSWENSDVIDPRSVIICSQPTDSIEGTPITEKNSEKELLIEFCSVIQQRDPDVLIGYNVNGFDNMFLEAKIQYYGLQTMYSTLGRVSQACFKEQMLSSSALGKNQQMLWAIPGRCIFDQFLYCKTNFPKLKNFKLDTAAEHFLNSSKDDVPFGKIFEAFDAETGTAALRGVIAKYCLQDGNLCNKLCLKWNMLSSIFEVRIYLFCLRMTLLTKVRAMMKKKQIKGVLKHSNRANKKLMLMTATKTIHFGLKGSTTFIEGATKQKRAAYRARHSKIILKNGKRAIDTPYTPAFLSYHLLW